MTPYRTAPPPPRLAPTTPVLRIVWTWARGVLRRAEERNYRNAVLRDPRGMADRSLGDAFKVAKIMWERGL